MLREDRPRTGRSVGGDKDALLQVPAGVLGGREEEAAGISSPRRGHLSKGMRRVGSKPCGH